METRVAVGTRLDKGNYCKDLGIYLIEWRKSLEEKHDLAHVSAGFWKPGHPLWSCWNCLGKIGGGGIGGMKVLGWFLICFEGREDMSCWQIWYRIWEKGFKDDAKVLPEQLQEGPSRKIVEGTGLEGEIGSLFIDIILRWLSDIYGELLRR